MSKDIEKYTNWRAITESDYVTMFIKTWFAFVATLRSLYPDIDVFAADGKPRGDRPFTNKFKEVDLVGISQDVSVKEFSDIIYKLYIPSREKIAKEFKQYFLTTFYRINETFNFKENNLKFKKTDRRELKERTAFDLRIKNRFTLSISFQIYGKYYSTNYSENVKAKINLQEIINSIDLTKPIYVDELGYIKEFYKKLYDKIQERVSSWTQNNLGHKYTLKIRDIILSKVNYCLMRLSKQFENNLLPTFRNMEKIDDEYMIIRQRPISLFSSEISRKNKSEAETDYFYQKMKGDLYFWFIDFVVSLRNALFHEIIDPLDEEWQLIYKNAYLALKELLDVTTKYLIKKEIATFIENKYIKEDNDELFEEIKSSLESEAFDLANYELIDDDIEINKIDVANIDFYDTSSVVVNKNKAKFRCRANILAGGRARVFDYNLSQYDKEDDKYYYIVHDELKFNNAEANVELEIEFEFDLRDIERTARICNVKPFYFGSIRLSLSGDDSYNDWEEIHPYEDDGEY